MVTVSRDEIIKKLNDRMPYLSVEYGVARIGLFGSYAKGLPHGNSDIDLIIEFKKPIGLRFMELIDYLESLLGRRVDVLTPAGLAGIRIKRVAEDINASVVYV